MKAIIFLSALFLLFINGCSKDDSTTNPVNGQNTVTDVDGNVYHTVKIGTQTWIVENLKVSKYRNGDPIPNITDNSQWMDQWDSGAYCKYDNSVGSGNTYGYLYNFSAVNDSRKIAPLGWHVPTAEEWETLINSLGSPSDVGGYLKESGTSHWNSPNEGAVNSTGFTALPGGRHNTYGGAQGGFVDIGEAGFWWTSSREGTLNPHNISIEHSSKAITAGYGWSTCGYSIRCVKD